MAKIVQPEDYIHPLNINGLEGRMLVMPSKKKHKQDILFIYGHHSSIERWWGLIQALHDYGQVTVPDLPGFGGMDSFYKIGKKPTIDNLADYLASFIKMRYKKRQVVICGLSFGFVVATRMLQRCPELKKNVKLFVSIVGFTDSDDFTFSKPRYNFYLYGCKFFGGKYPSKFFRYAFLNKFTLMAVYSKMHNAKGKFVNVDSNEDFKRLMNVEIGLWQNNDVRTWMFTTREFLNFSNCDRQIDLPIVDVTVKSDNYFDHNRVEQHMRVIFNDYMCFTVNSETHAPTVIATKKEASEMLPRDLKKLISSLK